MANGNGGNGDETGSKDRATVALVDAKVDGLRELIRAEFANVREKIEGLPDRVTRLEEKHAALEKRFADSDDTEQRGRDWKRAAVTTAVFAAVGTLVNLAINFHWLGT